MPNGNWDRWWVTVAWMVMTGVSAAAMTWGVRTSELKSLRDDVDCLTEEVDAHKANSYLERKEHDRWIIQMQVDIRNLNDRIEKLEQ